MIFDTSDDFDLLRCYTLAIAIPWEALVAVLNTRNPWRQPRPRFSLERGYLTVPQWISTIGISITQLLCIGRLTLRSSHLSVVSPLVTPLPILQSIHRPISPLPFLLCHHLTLPLSATFSAKNTHSPTSDSLSYPVSGSVS